MASSQSDSFGTFLDTITRLSRPAVEGATEVAQGVIRRAVGDADEQRGRHIVSIAGILGREGGACTLRTVIELSGLSKEDFLQAMKAGIEDGLFVLDAGEEAHLRLTSVGQAFS